MNWHNIGEIHWHEMGKSYHGLICVGELHGYSDHGQCVGYTNIPGSSLAFISGHCYLVKEGEELILITQRKDVAYETALRYAGRWEGFGPVDPYFDDYAEKYEPKYEKKPLDQKEIAKPDINEKKVQVSQDNTIEPETDAKTRSSNETNEPQRSIQRKKYSVFGTVSNSPPEWLTSNSIWLEKAWMRLEDGTAEALDNPIVMLPSEVTLPERGLPVEITGEAGFESSVKTFVFFNPVIVNYSKELPPSELLDNDGDDPFEITGPDIYELEPPQGIRAYGYSPNGKAVYIGKTEGNDKLSVYRELYKNDEAIIFASISYDVWFDGRLLFVTHDSAVAYKIADQIVSSGFTF